MRTLLSFLLFFYSPSLLWSQIYVSINGSDRNEGTINHPLQSVHMAVRKAREMRRLNDPSIKNGIEIIVGDGVYRLSETIVVRPEDAGTIESPTIVKAADGANPVLSGGFAMGGWKKTSTGIPGLPKSSIGKVWMTIIPESEGNLLSFRQLWVDGKKAVRARERNGDSMSRILSWDRSAQTCWIPKPKGIDFSKAKGVEMLIHQWWAIANLRIKSMKIVGDSIELSFHQPESRIQSEHPWPAPWISKKTGNSAFYLSNAIEFLDEPGEWFFDENNRKLYYYPRVGEFLGKATVIIPVMETLLKIEGTIDQPVSYFYFKGISFQYTTWLRPSKLGHVPLQAGMYLLDAYKLRIPGTPDKKGLENQGWIGRPAAAVEVSYANHTTFENCRFEHLASTGLDYKRGTRHDQITGNLFKDIGGSGILIGTFSDEAFETHLPYNPSDEREVCADASISNNLITNVTNEDWGCVGIGAGYVRGVSIEHNDISNVSYTGVSLGWGWTKTKNAMRDNRILANRITHYGKHMYDVAGIYTLSAQPGSLISNNYVDSIYKAPYAHDPDHWFYLYTDEGSAHITVKDNWCPSQKFLQNANGPGIQWENNGPMVVPGVRESAGLSGSFKYLLKERTIDRTRSINNFISENSKQSANLYGVTNKPIVVEVMIKEENLVKDKELLTIFSQHNLSSSDTYRWKNRFAIFGPLKDTAGFRNQIVSRIPGTEVKFYGDVVYAFDRGKCSNKLVVDEWENILLTANLVKDINLQQEYLQYHSTQFQNWPEVARGFCSANFQQLLVFKNGRQLMLVISIPKGKTLDELNPKTTENNPRVVEWNDLMKKYQEGIEGTKPGEVWVFLKPIIQ